ncbi:MAG TPA: DUF2849 domain-containing protein [Beijerinckiaceae bacterium]|nr:DUF2849 domain-containing protein [Beijerinckiaceae bacterium]
MPQVITANRLRDGAVVYFGPNERWVEGLQEAVLLPDPESVKSTLERALVGEKANVVLDLFAFDVERSGGEVRPIHIRDAIRASGPTVRQDLGKQAADLQPAAVVENDDVSI